MKSITLTLGGSISQRHIIALLLRFGYQKTHRVSYSGEFSQQGEIVDCWPVNSPVSVRVSWFGNQLESIRLALPRKTIAEVTIIPNSFISEGAMIHSGDYIIHLNYGVGRFLTLRTIDQRLAIVCEYAKGDRLYVPWECRDLLFPFQGAGRRPTLASLSHKKRWESTKKRVIASIDRLAKDLVLVAAARKTVSRPAYAIPTDWYRQLDQSVPFSLTNDQKQAVTKIVADVSGSCPMDRVLLGDVGFGKTEVALRAMVAAIYSGYQVVVLAPTTLLSDQLCMVIKERLSAFPIRIALINRFISRREKIQVIAQVKQGGIDILVGTQSILSGEVVFKQLGLLIIDEEQRFGVRQKELLKKRQVLVDTLHLSATPIPRTLFMALGGIRTLSLLSEPPEGRLNIHTQVQPFDWATIVLLISKEIARDGQSYVVYNRVESIEAFAHQLRRHLPGQPIIVVHGQLPEKILVRRMHQFSQGAAPILVCSSIIENGIDLPRVNTLIVVAAQRFGLSDLYQLRGRVGRSDRQAFACFLLGEVPSGKQLMRSDPLSHRLSSKAKARLTAIASITELGQGFAIASADLEIRGGGNLLGKEQSGNMAELGLVWYSKLLTQAVARIQHSTTTDTAVVLGRVGSS